MHQQRDRVTVLLTRTLETLAYRLFRADCGSCVHVLRAPRPQIQVKQSAVLWLGPLVTANVKLELLTPDHARPLERFERANRAFFAGRVGDRGDDFFEHFDDRLAARVREIREGASLFFVIVDGDGDGEILGRVNIGDIDQPELTELGFRIAEHAQGRGLATQGVISALDIAAARGVKAVKGRVSTANLASRRVLERCGFDHLGQADAPDGSSETFVGYRKDLVGAACSPSTEQS